jgi:lipoprotein-releasing system permease protein
MYLKFAWRYFKAKKSTHAINIISWVTLGVIAFSTMCQVLVLSVFNGFEGLVKSLYSNFYSDLKVLPAEGKTILILPEQINKIRLPGVKGVVKIAEEKALLKNGDKQSIVFLKGVGDDFANTSGVPKSMYQGNFDIGTMDNPKLVLGVGIASALDIETQKDLFPLTVFLPKKTSQTNPLAALSEGNATTAGSFAIQQEFDNKYAITNIGFVKQQMNYAPDEYSALEIYLTNPDQFDLFAKQIQNILGKKYKVVTKYQQNASLYRSMRLEKWIIYAILTLILIIAAFNMVGALTMLVLEKRKDINVLQSLGANNRLIKKIFLSEGVLLAVAGAATGIVMAILICIAQVKFKIIKLYGTSFLIDYFPVKMQLSDFILVAFTAFAIAFAASWFPANKASHQSFTLKT